MNHLIENMSSVQIPDEVLDQLDMNELVDRLRRNFKRLDDFKNTRNAYEKRSFWKKMGDAVTFDSTLEDAQLNAVEIQAEFAKNIGQLMVISVAQAGQLHLQQQQLSSQQSRISAQTQEIAGHTIQLKTQQQKLQVQNDEIQELLTNYMKLSGLTQEGAKKLVQAIEQMRALRDDLLIQVNGSLTRMNQELNTAMKDIASAQADLQTSVNQKIGQLQQNWDEARSRLTERVAEQGARHQILSETVSEKTSSLHRDQAQIAADLARLESAAQAENQALRQKAEKMSTQLESLTTELVTQKQESAHQLSRFRAAVGALALVLGSLTVFVGWFKA